MTLKEYRDLKRRLQHQHNYHLIDSEELVGEIEQALLTVPKAELLEAKEEDQSRLISLQERVKSGGF